MREYKQFYINGEWVDPVTPNEFDVVNPATEEVYGRISIGSAAVATIAPPARSGWNCWSPVSRFTRSITTI